MVYNRYLPISVYFKGKFISARKFHVDRNRNVFYMIFDSLKDANGKDAVHLELHEHYDEAQSMINDRVNDVVSFIGDVQLGIHFHDAFITGLGAKAAIVDAFVNANSSKLSFCGTGNSIAGKMQCCKGCSEHPIWYGNGISCTFEDLLNWVNSGQTATKSKIHSLLVEMLELRKMFCELLIRLI